MRQDLRPYMDMKGMEETEMEMEIGSQKSGIGRSSWDLKLKYLYVVSQLLDSASELTT